MKFTRLIESKPPSKPNRTEPDSFFRPSLGGSAPFTTSTAGYTICSKLFIFPCHLFPALCPGSATTWSRLFAPPTAAAEAPAHSPRLDGSRRRCQKFPILRSSYPLEVREVFALPARSRGASNRHAGKMTGTAPCGGSRDKNIGARSEE